MHDCFGPRAADVTMSAGRANVVLPDALSFPRAAMRELVLGRYCVRKLRFELDAEGKGEVLYQLVGQGRIFHFFLVSDLIPEGAKTDRNFAQGWDAMGVLCEGEWTARREAHLRREVPRQRAGYADYDTLMYARGNRSGRIFEHVVESLANGRQPDMRLLAPIGYILRTTAFIGNGQLGTRPLSGYEPEHPFRRPYHAQFFSAFMLREFVFDLVEHLALLRNPDAARLAPEYRRYLGLGNSAATGLAAYAVNNARQLQQWTRVHEEALVRAVQASPVLAESAGARFRVLLGRAVQYFDEAGKPGDGVFATPEQTGAGLRAIGDQISEGGRFFDAREKTISLVDLIAWARTHVGGEALEVLHSLVLELHPRVAEDFVDDFIVGEESVLRAEATAGEMLAMLKERFDWVLDAEGADDHTYFWYRCTSAPRDVRRGLRGRLPHVEFESNFELPRKINELFAHLQALPTPTRLGTALAGRPDLRHVAQRVQALGRDECGVLREQWLSAQYQPFGSIRFVLSFFGMEKFEAAMPKSVRGTFLQGAPIAEDVALGREGTWPYPLMPALHAPLQLEQLAPLPPNAGRATRVSASVDVEAPEDLRIAPGELKRMITSALQGHGMPLGVAEESAAYAVFEHARGRPAVQAVLRQAADRLVAAVVPSVKRIHRGARSEIHFDAQRHSALATAALAADLAIEAILGLGQSRVSVRVSNATEPWLVQSLVQRCARRGLASMLLWRGRNDSGLAAGGPQEQGCWYAQATGPVALSSAEQSADSPPAAFASSDEGYLLVCARAVGGSPEDQMALLADSQCSGASVTPARELDALRFCWEREGIPISRHDFAALERAGASILVPQASEHMVLREGADPLKTF